MWQEQNIDMKTKEKKASKNRSRKLRFRKKMIKKLRKMEQELQEVVEQSRPLPDQTEGHFTFLEMEKPIFKEKLIPQKDQSSRLRN